MDRQRHSSSWSQFHSSCFKNRKISLKFFQAIHSVWTYITDFMQVSCTSLFVVGHVESTDIYDQHVPMPNVVFVIFFINKIVPLK